MDARAENYQMVFPLSKDDPLEVTVLVTDPEVLQALYARQAGEERDRFVTAALRIGVLSLRTASGQVDATTIREAGDRLLSDLRTLLGQRATEMGRDLSETLRSYFDPQSGMVSQRLRALVERDGELARVLSAHVGGDESELARTLMNHLGEKSPLFQMLSPTASEGLKAQLQRSVEGVLQEQREKILGEFSLDRENSALRRLIKEVETRHKALSTDLGNQVGEVVKEFSLDHENSALSRLVSRVEQSQRSVQTQLTDFRVEMTERLSVLSTQKQETARSPQKGVLFEQALADELATLAQRQGDVFEHIGAKQGVIKNCKVGDAVIELGPESPAAGARIVFEAKEDGKYDLRRALAEIEQARKNRQAQIGVFVFSVKGAPAGLEPFARYGDDLIVLWDAEAPVTNVYLKAAYTTARALTLRVNKEHSQAEGALDQIEYATRAVEKQIRYLEDIRRHAETARSSGVKIVERAEKMAADLASEVERLDDQLLALRQSTKDEG
jgi:hypothetical protein